MQKTITIHRVITSESQLRQEGKPEFVYRVTVESSDGLLTLEFPEKPARDMAALLTGTLPKKVKE